MCLKYGMEDVRKLPDWVKAKKLRMAQGWFGWISAIFLAVALLALLDGLISQMRADSNEITLLPGQKEAIASPLPLKNALVSDLRATFTPEDAPLRYETEGFFSGYWFGSGMWRGYIIADANAGTGAWTLRISFRGASAQTTQFYQIKIFENYQSLRKNSHSLLHCFADLQPFYLAACSAAIGLLLGVFTYFLGRAYAKALSRLNLAQIYSNRGREVCCLAKREFVGNDDCAILDRNGMLMGWAKVEKWHKGKLFLQLRNDAAVDLRGLVCLTPLEFNKHKPDQQHKTN